jgi:regulator of protease activity HflC (stomatin/prohibitin superfamily)
LELALIPVIGQHQLDEVLKERDKINTALQTVVDAATGPWGVKVEMVEMKDVEISANPAALELRRMQMITEVGAEQNTKTIIMMPSDFVLLAKALTEKLGGSLDT